MIFYRDDLAADAPSPTALYAAVASAASANAWTSINGFAAPRIFTSAEDEYAAATTRVAVADFGPAIRYAVRGKAAGAVLARLASLPASAMAPGECARGLMLDERGQVLDLAEALRLSEDLFLLACTRRHGRRMLLASRSFDAEVEEISGAVAALGLIGPEALQAAAALGVELDGASAVRRKVRGVELSARMFSIGDHAGVEIIYPKEEALTVWERLRRARMLHPIGVDALEILRIEAGVPRPGVDFATAEGSRRSQLRAPEEIGLGHLAPRDRGWFNGRRALVKQKPPARRLVVVKIDADAAAPAAAVFARNTAVGRITSAAFSPRLRQAVAFADLGAAAAGKPIEVATAGEGAARASAEILETAESRLALAWRLATDSPSSAV